MDHRSPSEYTHIRLPDGSDIGIGVRVNVQSTHGAPQQLLWPRWFRIDPSQESNPRGSRLKFVEALSCDEGRNTPFVIYTTFEKLDAMVRESADAGLSEGHWYNKLLADFCKEVVLVQAELPRFAGAMHAMMLGCADAFPHADVAIRHAGRQLDDHAHTMLNGGAFGIE